MCLWATDKEPCSPTLSKGGFQKPRKRSSVSLYRMHVAVMLREWRPPLQSPNRIMVGISAAHAPDRGSMYVHRGETASWSGEPGHAPQRMTSRTQEEICPPSVRPPFGARLLCLGPKPRREYSGHHCGGGLITCAQAGLPGISAYGRCCPCQMQAGAVTRQAVNSVPRGGS
jgi:hypothetical protein